MGQVVVAILYICQVHAAKPTSHLSRLGVEQAEVVRTAGIGGQQVSCTQGVS